MRIGVPTETAAGERRVALVPAVLPLLSKTGLETCVQKSAGEKAGYPDADYESQGAKLATDRSQLFSSAELVVQVNAPGGAELDLLRKDQVLIALLNPLGAPQNAAELARRGVTAFALELLPRISRAQPMDALTSMATLSGYKGALLAAATLEKLYPMMITAAGTLTPARVLVVGAGVAGLQAIATSRALGAVVHAYDIRPAVKEQVESLGARFVELGLETKSTEAAGGYAQAMGEDFYRRQREVMKQVVAESDIVITTALVPGQKAPVLITEEMVGGMRPGSVIVDLAAEGGGNCALTRLGETIAVNGVTILGPANLPSSLPHPASQMYARNITAFVQNLVKKGQLEIKTDDPIIRETLLTRNGEVVHPRVRERLGLPALAAPAPERSPA